MTMDFRDKSSTTTSSGATLAGTIPSGTQAGDLLIVFATSGASSDSITTPPQSWSIVPGSLITGADLTSVAYWRYYVSGVPGPSFIWSNSSSAKTVDVVAYQHEISATSLSVIQAQTTKAVTTGSINMTVTPHADNCWLIGFVAANNALSITWTHAENIPYISQTEFTQISADEPINARLEAQTNSLNRQVFDESLLGGQDQTISRTTIPSLSDAQIGIMVAVKFDDPLNVVSYVNSARVGVACKKQIIGDIPAGTLAGDLMLAFVWSGSSFSTVANTGPTSIIPPSTWNEAIPPTVAPHTTGQQQQCAVYYKHYDSIYDEDPVWNLTTIAASATVDIVSYRGGQQSSPIDVVNYGLTTNGNKTIVLAPQSNDCMLVGWALVDTTANVSWTNPSTMNQRLDDRFDTGNRVIVDELLQGQQLVAQSRTIVSSVSADMFMALISIKGRHPDPLIPVFEGISADELPRLLVEMQIGGLTGTQEDSTQLILDDPAHDMVGTATLSPGVGGIYGFTGVFTDVTDQVINVDISRGAQAVTGSYTEYDAGSCTITLVDPDRRFDPTNLQGPYVVNGKTLLLPMVKVRVRAQYPTGSTIYQLFEGFVDSWNVEWNPPNWAQVTVACTDAFKVFESNALAEIQEETLPAGINDRTDERVNRVLDLMQWPINKRKIMYSNVYLSGTQYGDTGLEELKRTALTEVGHVFMSMGGDLVFFSRNTPYIRSMSVNSQLTLGDDETTDAATYRDIKMEYDDAALINQVTITPPKSPTTIYPAIVDDAGETENTSEPIPEPTPEIVLDQDSINKYLLHYADFSDLFLPYNDQDAARAWGGWYLIWSKDPEQRIETITINPRSQPGILFPQVLSREIMDRITIIRRPFGVGDPIQRDLHIAGIQFAISPMSWGVQWQFRDAKFGDPFSGYGINLFEVDIDSLDSDARIAF